MTVDWTKLVSQHGPMVFGTAMRILGNAADAEDIVQETFLEAQQIVGRGTVNHWPGMLRRVATCRAVDALRRRRVTEGVDEQSIAASDATPLERLTGQELADRLRVALTELTSRESTVFCLRYFEDLSYAEIAEASSSVQSKDTGTTLAEAT